MFIISLYNLIIYRPLLNLLVFFYNVLPGHDIGIVIIVITFLIRLVLAPSFTRSLKSQKALNDLQPKLNEIREKYKDKKEEQAKAMMELYKENKINPLASCLPLVIQLPILIAINQVFRESLAGHNLSGLYSFVHVPSSISPLFLHFIDLSRVGWGATGLYWPGVVLAILTGISQFWQSKLMMAKNNGQAQDPMMRATQVQMTYIFPVVFIYIALRFATGLALYWTATTLFTVAQQYYILRKS